jgi:hypothetical protein
MTTKKYARNPGQDQVAAWKHAIAAANREKRQRRTKRRSGIGRVDGPGMIRLNPGQRAR